MNIKELLRKHESKTLEFKKSLNLLKPILRTIVAFANTAGGVLIIGKEDNGDIVGISDIRKQQDRLANAIAGNIRPKHLFPEFEFYTEKESKKDLLIVQVHHFPEPFYIKEEGGANGVYLRLGATTRRAPPEFIAEIRRRKLNQYFDEEPCLKAKKDYLDEDLIKQTFSNKSYKMSKEKRITLKILCEQNGKIYPTNGGVILFGKEDERLSLFPNTEISCARFSGVTKAEFIDRLDITESSLAALEQIPKFIRRNIKMSAEFGDIKRKDIPEYPMEAIREVLINAIIHANYELKGSRFFVAIYDDRLEIQNPGNFPPGMTIEDFKAGISKIRNPMIARIFREKENLEGWGSGFERIRSICEEKGYPLPEWEEVGSVVRIKFYPREFIAESKQAPSRHQAGTKQAPSRHQAGTKQALSKEEREILVFCKSPKSTRELLDRLKYRDRTKFRARYINPLVDKKLLEMTVPHSPSSPKQKYRTTEFGIEQLKNK